MDEELNSTNTFNDDDVVITGLAGVYPKSENAHEFCKNLFAKKDLTSEIDPIWRSAHPNIPPRMGKVESWSKFDASYFNISEKQAHYMDPMVRVILEKSYEAVIDAGYNPSELRGSHTGTFVGNGFIDSEYSGIFENLKHNKYGLLGVVRTLGANRISFWLDLHGPSYAVDTTCSSSGYALEHAYKAIKNGECDAALVGGSNAILMPQLSIQLTALGVLSKEGRCKTYDESRDGYCRSEAVVVIFLQKKKSARRIYAQVVHAKTNFDGYKPDGLARPSTTQQQILMEEFYKECKVDPLRVDYVEPHGTATRIGDTIEVEAMQNVFCIGRKQPLKIGSVKSNMGHGEASSALCSVTKLVLAFESNRIPPNINFNNPGADISALHNGRIKVVTEPTRWEGEYAASSSFGVGGTNFHVLLRCNPKRKINDGLPEDDLPRLVTTSGRTEQAVDFILNDLENKVLDREQVRLLHEIHKKNIIGHSYRGYTLLKKRKCEPVRNIELYDGAQRPVWFLFSGMGSQWTSMGKNLLQISICAESLRQSHTVLQSKDIDLLDIITKDDPHVFDNVTNIFVGISAIQIALFKLISAVSIEADGFIGHSFGELACALADGCLTEEQVLLAAYYRGVTVAAKKSIDGSMASIGIGYEELKNMVPKDIDIACHNGPSNCTVSGPPESIDQFIEQMRKRNVFTSKVNVCNVAFHSRYILSCGASYEHYLRNIVPTKTRSSKWLSTSIHDSICADSSATYFRNNLLNPVFFEEAFRKVPDNAIVIEIAPSGVLQSIVKRSTQQNLIHVPLMPKNSENVVDHLFCALGKLFVAGLQPKLHPLYPAVEFPVSRGTPMLAPLVKWDHSFDWFVLSYKPKNELTDLVENNVEGDQTIKNSIPQYSCSRDKSYIVCGQRGIFSLGLIDWLIQRGACKIVLSSHDGKNGALPVQEWRSDDIDIIVSNHNTTDETAVEKLLNSAVSLGPVAAIFNFSEVSNDLENDKTDATKANDELHDIIKLTKSGGKSNSTSYLDKVSRKICPQLEHFVVFSSDSQDGVEEICEQRKQDNLPALILRWDVIGDIEKVEDREKLKNGFKEQFVSCTDTLEYFMTRPKTMIYNIVMADKNAKKKTLTPAQRTLEILGMKNMKYLNLHTKLSDMGIDSHTALEIRKIIQKEFGFPLSIKEMNTVTFARLNEMASMSKINGILTP